MKIPKGRTLERLLGRVMEKNMRRVLADTRRGGRSLEGPLNFEPSVNLAHISAAAGSGSRDQPNLEPPVTNAAKSDDGDEVEDLPSEAAELGSRRGREKRVRYSLDFAISAVEFRALHGVCAS